MKKFFTALALSSFSTLLWSQSVRIEDHWKATQITYEQTLYGEINDQSCQKSLGFFVGCINALNTALSLSSDKIYYLIPDSSSKDPVPGFRAMVLTGTEEDPRSIHEAYLKDLVKYYNDQQALGVLAHVSFSAAAESIAPQVKASKDESYLTSLIYNAFLSDAYDPHTYITPRAHFENQGAPTKIVKAFGFGYSQTTYNGQKKIIITSVAQTSQARSAGLRPGDIILDINAETELSPMVSKINAADSLDLNLVNADGVKNLKLERCDVKVENIESSLIKDAEGKSYLYIKLANFLDPEACTNIKNRSLELLSSSPEGVILDLRNNGGGRVDVAKCLMSLYLEPGSLNWVEKNLSTNKVSASLIREDARIFKDLAAVVLINAKSASASEALAMFLQAYRKAYVLGEPSFGKGTMQVINAYNPEASVLKAQTIAKYYGPHLISPQLQGVRPDIIALPSIRQDKPTPAQRERDLYNNAILNAPKPVPTMASRMAEVGTIVKCLNEKKMNVQEFEALDEFKQRVFDNQLSSATSVLNCVSELRIPVYQGTRIPTADTLE